MSLPNAIRRPFRALFLDIDGTLTDSRNHISPRVREAVARARQAGCHVALCTGRSRYTTEPVAEKLGEPGYAVTSNGGVAMHLGTGEVLLRRVMPAALAQQVARTIVELGAEPYIYEDSIGNGIKGARALYLPHLPTGEFARHPRYQPDPHLLQRLPFEPVSVSAYGDVDKMRPLAERLQARLPAELDIIESGSDDMWGVEIFPRGVNKRTGLEAVARRLDVAREEIMAIGDHFNDLEMLRWAGWGVAMGNAIPEIRDAADHITASLDEDGVAVAIEQFIL